VQKYRDDTLCRESYFGLLAKHHEGWVEWRMRDFNIMPPNCWVTSTINARHSSPDHPALKSSVDFGFILRAPNPFNPDAGVVIVCGIHGVGTFGAALYLFQNADTLLIHHGDEPQIHLVEVKYAIPPNRNNYLESEIQPPLYLRSTAYLHSMHSEPAETNET
jgi:hypothetical protein